MKNTAEQYNAFSRKSSFKKTPSALEDARKKCHLELERQNLNIQKKFAEIQSIENEIVSFEKQLGFFFMKIQSIQKSLFTQQSHLTELKEKMSSETNQSMIHRWIGPVWSSQLIALKKEFLQTKQSISELSIESHLWQTKYNAIRKKCIELYQKLEEKELCLLIENHRRTDIQTNLELNRHLITQKAHRTCLFAARVNGAQQNSNSFRLRRTPCKDE